MATIVLTKSREGGDITFHLRIKDNGVYLSWDDLQEKRVFLFSDAQDVLAGECRQVTVRESDSTYLDCVYGGDQPQYLGENSVLVRAEYRGRQKTYDKKAIYIVARTAELEGEEIVVTDPEVDVDIDVADVSTSILEAAIAAAIAAAADAEEAAHLVPLQVLQDCREATGEAVEAAGNANDAAEEARAAGEHAAPIIGPNGNWWRWLPEISQYVDTGNPSCGPQGERGPQGVSIQSIEQTQTSEESEGENRITVTLDNGQTATFVVRNGAQGIQGAPGASNARYKQVAFLPVASAETMDFIYLTESATTGIYNMSYTEYDPGTDTYSWRSLGTTAIQLSDYATKEELSQLGQEPINQVGYWSDSQNQYVTTGGSSLFIFVEGYDTIDIVGQSVRTGNVAFVTAFSPTGITFVSGVTGTTSIAKNGIVSMQVPEDAKYLMVFSTDASNNDRKPASITADGYRNLLVGQMLDMWSNITENTSKCGILNKKLDQFSQEPITQDGYWSNTENKYITSSGKTVFIPCSVYSTILISAQRESVSQSSVIAFVKDFTGDTITFVSGVSGTETIPAQTSASKSVPDDAMYLMVLIEDGNGNDRSPNSITGDGQRDLYKSFVEDMIPIKSIPAIISASTLRYRDGVISWTALSILLADGSIANVESTASDPITVTNKILVYRPTTGTTVLLALFNDVKVGDIVLVYNKSGELYDGILLPYIKKFPFIVAASSLSFDEDSGTVSWTSLSILNAYGGSSSVPSGTYSLGSSYPILVYRPTSNSVARIDSFSNVFAGDILLAYYRGGRFVSGALVGYYYAAKGESSPIVLAATNAEYVNGELSWQSLDLRLPNEKTVTLSGGTYIMDGGSPILLYRPTSNGIIQVQAFSSVKKNDILIAYYRTGYGIISGAIAPYLNTNRANNDKYDDDLSLNISRRGEQLKNIVWTPLAAVDSGEGIHPAGTPVTGIPYSSVKEYLKFVGIDVSIHTFMTTVHDPHSLLYTENPMGESSQSAYGRTYHGVNCKCYFGNVCSAFVASSLGILEQIQSWEFNTRFDLFEILKSQKPEYARVGDILSYNGHCAIISNVERNTDGTIRRLFVSEQAAPIITSGYTPERLAERLFKNKAHLCRTKYPTVNLGYTPSVFVLRGNEPLYREMDLVYVDGSSERTYYMCLTPNRDSQMVASKWSEIGKWVSGTPYSVGEYKSLGDNLYQCLEANSDSSFNPAKWVKVKGAFEWCPYPYVYNDDIVTFAGDRAAFRTNDLIYINYNKGNYTQMQIYKDGTLIQTLTLEDTYQMNVSSYCSSAGMYKARLTDGTNYSRFTYFEVIDTTVLATYSGGVVTIQFSSSNGTPFEFQITEQSGYPVANCSLSDKEIKAGRVVVCPKALHYVLKNVYWGRYDDENPIIYARVIFEGEYGNVTNDMILLGEMDVVTGIIVKPSESVDLGTLSGESNIILAMRMDDSCYEFSFVAGANADVHVFSAIGTIRWKDALPNQYVQGTTYLFRVVNGIGMYETIN